MNKLVLCACFAVVITTWTAVGQDKKITPEMQKKMADEAMKAAGIKEASIVESPHIVLASSLPTAGAEKLVGNLEKVYTLAKKALRFENAPMDEPKYQIYAFGDVDAFRGYVRSVLKRSPDKDEYSIIDFKGDIPLIVVSAQRNEKTPNYDAMISQELTGMLLAKRGGNAKIDSWMKDGFHKAVMSRIDPKVGAAEKTKIRTLARPLAKNAKITTTLAEKAWGEANAERDAIAMSLMEFFTFGAGAPKFQDILSGLTPSEEVRMPTMMSALMGMEWKDATGLERAWRDWVSKGSPSTLK